MAASTLVEVSDGSQLVSVHYKITVTTAGTRVQLVATSQKIKSMVVVPWSGNTGKIYLAGLTVDSNTDDVWTSTDSVRIAPGRGYIDPTIYFLDSSVNGEGANILYMAQ